MIDHGIPRLSFAARQAILDQLSKAGRSTAIPLSRTLKDIRARSPALPESDKDLIHHIVITATNHGLAIQFDNPKDPN